MKVSIEPMTIDHYDEVIALWKMSENVGLSNADEREGITSYLARNPVMSFVAKEDDHIVGAALCGHDGGRGYLHHLAIKESHRKRGIGTKLAERCMESLRNEDIQKCHLFVIHTNKGGKAFWERIGWSLRWDIQALSKEL
jgi:ribosomal protein S18 acetylase RimI-like enzyme